jgi:hypothetical protein
MVPGPRRTLLRSGSCPSSSMPGMVVSPSSDLRKTVKKELTTAAMSSASEYRSSCFSGSTTEARYGIPRRWPIRRLSMRSQATRRPSSSRAAMGRQLYRSAWNMWSPGCPSCTQYRRTAPVSGCTSTPWASSTESISQRGLLTRSASMSCTRVPKGSPARSRNAEYTKCVTVLEGRPEDEGLLVVEVQIALEVGRVVLCPVAPDLPGPPLPRRGSSSESPITSRSIEGCAASPEPTVDVTVVFTAPPARGAFMTRSRERARIVGAQD